jgi:hypothetical protein
MIDPVLAQSRQMADDISNAPPRACRYGQNWVPFQHEGGHPGADCRIVLSAH